MNATKAIALDSTKREVFGKGAKGLLKEGLVPAVVYGRKLASQPICVKKIDFMKVYREAGASTLVDLKIEGKTVKTLIKEPQFNPVTSTPIHVDFYAVKMDEKIKTEIPLEFIGESDAVENFDGSLVTNKDFIEIECLPTDLVSQINVDLSALKTFEDQITIADIQLPAGMELLSDPEEVVCFVEEPRSEEEMAELEESTAEQEKEALEKMEEKAEAEKEGEEAEAEENQEK